MVKWSQKKVILKTWPAEPTRLFSPSPSSHVHQSEVELGRKTWRFLQEMSPVGKSKPWQQDTYVVSERILHIDKAAHSLKKSQQFMAGYNRIPGIKMETKKPFILQKPQITNATSHFQITYFSEQVKLSREQTILMSERLTWVHYPVTSGWLQFENCFIASQVQIPLEKEGKACMQGKKDILKTKV